jgi:hypothetical protein
MGEKKEPGEGGTPGSLFRPKEYRLVTHLASVADQNVSFDRKHGGN